MKLSAVLKNLFFYGGFLALLSACSSFSPDTGGLDGSSMNSSSQPSPGGIVAPGVDYGGENNVLWALTGSVSTHCRETKEHYKPNGESVVTETVNTSVKGNLSSKGADGTTYPLTLSYWLRLTEGEGDALRCYNIRVKPPGDFGKIFMATDPASFQYFISFAIKELFPFPPPCNTNAMAKEFFPLDKKDIVLNLTASSSLNECQFRADTKKEDDNKGRFGIDKPPPKIPSWD